MLIQGEKVGHLNVEEGIESIFGDSMHDKRQKSLANGVLAVISSASLIVHRIGLGLERAKKLIGKHGIKQVDRLLSNKKLKLPDCFQHIVPYIIGPRLNTQPKFTYLVSLLIVRKRPHEKTLEQRATDVFSKRRRRFASSSF